MYVVYSYNNLCDIFTAEAACTNCAREKMKHFYSVYYEDDRHPAVGVSVDIVLCIMQLQ